MIPPLYCSLIEILTINIYHSIKSISLLYFFDILNTGKVIKNFLGSLQKFANYKAVAIKKTTTLLTEIKTSKSNTKDAIFGRQARSGTRTANRK